jgi:hypothetical protein
MKWKEPVGIRLNQRQAISFQLLAASQDNGDSNSKTTDGSHGLDGIHGIHGAARQPRSQLFAARSWSAVLRHFSNNVFAFRNFFIRRISL